MFGKKSLGFHCWDEKDEVILVRQERAHHTKDGRQVCVFSHRLGTPLGAGGDERECGNSA